MSIVKFRPSQVSAPFAHLFDNYLGRDHSLAVPPVNILETEEGYWLEVAAPGLKKELFELSINHNVLAISYKKEEKTEDTQAKYTRKEFLVTSFQRTFTLPNTVETDRIEAKYTDGILHVFVPKREEMKTKPIRTIEVA